MRALNLKTNSSWSRSRPWSPGVQVRINTPITQSVVTGPGAVAAVHAQHIGKRMKNLAAIPAKAAEVIEGC
jgi:hypothetical protein